MIVPETSQHPEILVRAAVALLIVSWATHSNKIGELFNAVLDRLKGHAEQ